MIFSRTIPFGLLVDVSSTAQADPTGSFEMIDNFGPQENQETLENGIGMFYNLSLFSLYKYLINYFFYSLFLIEINFLF